MRFDITQGSSDDDLLKLADEVGENSYDKWSAEPRREGAVVITDQGEAYAGSYVENVNYTNSVGGLATAFGSAIADGGFKEISGVGLSTNNLEKTRSAKNIYFLREFTTGDELVAVRENRNDSIYRVDELLDLAEDPEPVENTFEVDFELENVVQRELTDEDLVDLALQTQEHAYNPDSGYPVGSVVRMNDGSVFRGCNIENQDISNTTHGEGNAIRQALTHGKNEIDTVVVAAESNQPADPCGLCRQTIAEFSDRDTSVIAIGTNEKAERSMAEELPYAFEEF